MPTECCCYRCVKESGELCPFTGSLGILKADNSFIVCETCGNKRCPHATDHRLECTNSNESGQPGSRYKKAVFQ
jgi:hypothetical protein